MNGGTSVLGEGAQTASGGEPAQGGTATSHAGSTASGGSGPSGGSTASGGGSGGDGGTASAAESGAGGTVGGSFDGGASGSADWAGAGGSTQGGSAGTPQGGTNSGAAGSGGSGGVATAGSGGTSCTLEWFPDDDRDGYGRSSGKVVACARPSSGKWVHVGGDCNDDNGDVLPDTSRAKFSPEPYTASDGNDSFDYDCSGSETSGPGQLGAAAACNSLLGLDCKGQGYLVTGRTGPGVNGVCGSQQVQTCAPGTLACVASVQTVAEKHRCR